MTTDNKGRSGITNDGYQPGTKVTVEKGYVPGGPGPAGDTSNPQGGHQPTTGSGAPTGPLPNRGTNGTPKK